MKSRSPAIPALCGLALALASCSSATSDWNKAVQENTIAGYQNCLAAHPQDEGASEAKALILQRQDDESWTEAMHTATEAKLLTSTLKVLTPATAKRNDILVQGGDSEDG